MGIRFAAVVFVAAALAPAVLAQQPALDWPQNAPSKVTIAPASEPGQRLVVTGRVFDSSGRPLAGALMHAYHTDAAGLYLPDSSNARWPEHPPRLQGYAQTDADGRYEFDTVKPAAYPNRPIPAHIHVHLRRPDGSMQGDEIWFSGDPLLKPDERARYSQDGTFSRICAVTSDANRVLHCTRDFKLK